MPRMRVLAGAVSVAATITGLAIAGAGGSAGAAVRPSVLTVAGSVAPFVSHTQVIGSVPAGQRLSIQVWLALRRLHDPLKRRV
jgi:hypothetical protein